jgi:dTMP kinase
MLDLEPDLTIMLELPLPEALQRMASRGRAADRYEQMGEGFLTRVNQAFSAIAEAEPERCVVVSAEGGVQTVAARIREAVWQRLTPGVT